MENLQETQLENQSRQRKWWKSLKSTWIGTAFLVVFISLFVLERSKSQPAATAGVPPINDIREES